ncbi:MFS transporter [Rhodococcus sp. Z13]|uniref:MFS transporter n=1 Tax=Rhodococcus sacchari TaxID=2962047 RepID=A0ACD4DIT4_9NOCA|nr:MFS transporter [Rhodococcus sp. Z13]UYP19980.1 MFS transporter [Rhodococcus sp. Z13]
MSSPVRAGAIPSGVLILLAALYFAQGLPYGFFTQALPVVLREEGLSLTAISATGILFAPWALKFLWAPYVDRYGTRRQWLLTLQLAASAVALVLACLDLSTGLTLLLVGIAVVNAISATQDVATDGLAVQLLGPQQRGLGNGIQVGAYRIGMIVGGGALLWLFSLAGWRSLFLAMAVLLLLTTIPVWTLRQTATRGTSQPAPARGAKLSVEWWARLRRPGMIAFILLIGGFKFGDSMGSAMVGPFMSDAGLTLGQIALVKGVLSSVGALAGAALGGWLCFHWGRRTALLIGGVTQTASIVLYVVAALGYGGFGTIVSASLAEHVLGGAATVAVFTLMMDASDRDHAGSDYTLLACAVVVVQGIAGVAAGVVGDAFGYPVLFGTSFVLSGIGCAVLLLAMDRGQGPVGVHRVWRTTPSGRLAAS